MKMATLLQEDLSQLGMQVHVVPLEFRAMIGRVFQNLDYEAAIMGLGGGDADPNPEMNVWTANGTSRLWNLNPSHPANGWEREIDETNAETDGHARLHQKKAVVRSCSALDHRKSAVHFPRNRRISWQVPMPR